MKRERSLDRQPLTDCPQRADHGVSNALILQRRVDDFQHDSGGQQVSGRPAHPAADLQGLAAAKLQGAVVHQVGFITIQKAHPRNALIHIPVMRNFGA